MQFYPSCALNYTMAAFSSYSYKSMLWTHTLLHENIREEGYLRSATL
jgi:hypothetical protein